MLSMSPVNAAANNLPFILATGIECDSTQADKSTRTPDLGLRTSDSSENRPKNRH